MIKLNDEFNYTGNESNKAIPENLDLPAIEYPNINEAVTPPLEVIPVVENSQAQSKNTNVAQASKTENLNEIQDRINKINNARNTADGLKSPDMNAIEAAADASGGAAAEATAASTAAATTATSTVASLAGGITVVAAAAVGIAVVTGGVLEKKPEVKFESFEVGTNFIKYELDVDSLSDDMEYFIRVSNPNFVKEFKIESAGMQRQIVTGLKPYRNYDVEIIGISKDIGEVPYYKHTCGTNQLPKPKAVFKFEPHFDYLLGKIDLDYEAFISDYYNAGGNEYLQISVGQKLIIDDHNMPEDHFFKGTIKNISNIDNITAVAYSDYYDGLDLYEGIEIGSYGYKIELPTDFTFETDFKSIYTFDKSCFYNEFDFEKGNTLKVNTNFNNEVDETESYRIDIYNSGDLDLNSSAEPIDSIVSTDKELNFLLDSYIKYVDVKFTQLKQRGDDLIEYDSTVLKEIEVDPKIMKEKEYRISQNGFYYEMEILEDYQDLGDVSAKFTLNYKDGTSEDVSQSGGNYLSVEGSYSNGKTASDLESMDLEIKYNGIIIEKSRIYNDLSVKLSQFDIADNGNILLPYEIELPANCRVDSVWAHIDYADMNEDYNDAKGIFEIKSIESNIISGVVSVNYYVGGRLVTRELDIDSFDIGATSTISYYATHYNSYHDTLNIKVDTTLDGKNINVNPKLSIADYWNEYTYYDDITINGNKIDYFGYHAVNSSDQKVKYKFTAPGFDDTEHSITLDAYITDNSSDYSDYTAGYESERKAYIDYLKTPNNDGTANYYFDTSLISGTNNHYGKIYYSYVENGITKYGESEYTAEKYIKLFNLKDYEYTFNYVVYYLKNDLYYDISPIVLDESSSKKIDSFYYECREVKNTDVLDVGESTISTLFNQEDDTTLTVIDFDLDLYNLDKNSPINVTYNGNDYNIPFKKSTDDGVESDSDGYEYFYEFEANDGSYGYKVEVSREEIIRIELFVKTLGNEVPKKATVKVSANSNRFIDKYNENNTDSIINLSNLSSEASVDIGVFNGKINLDKYTITVDDVYGYAYELVVRDIGFSSTDSRDKIDIVAYSEGVEVARQTLNNGMARLNIEPGYTNVELKISKYKEQTIQNMTDYGIQESYVLDLGEEDLDTAQANGFKILDSLSVDLIDNSTFRVVVTADDFSDYIIEAQYEAKEDETSEYKTLTVTEEKGTNTIEFEKLYDTRRIKVKIYKVDYYDQKIYFGSYDLVFDANIGNYIYNDGEDSISLPYELIIPDGAAVLPDSSINGSSISYREDNYVITELDSDILTLSFDISYEINGTTVTYSFNKEVKLQGETTLIDEINSFPGNSSLGNYSQQYIRYDEENNIAYYRSKDGNDYFDKDGNPDPDTAVSAEMNNKIYTYSGNVYNKVGCFNLPYEKEYEIKVYIAGGNILNSVTGEKIQGSSQLEGSPDDMLAEYTVSSNVVEGIYLTFFHELLNQYYSSEKKTLYGQSKCQLKFDVVVDGEILFSKDIEFTEPAYDNLIDINQFNYDRNEVNNSILKNDNGTINMTIDTGFDSSSNPNYAYKLKLYEKSDFYSYDNQGLIYESDYLVDDVVVIHNIKNTNYSVYLETYYVENGNYASIEKKELGYANSPFAKNTDWDFNYSAGTYTNILYLDKRFINEEYLDGTKKLSFTLNSRSGVLDLSNTDTSQTVGGNTVTVSDENGILTVEITANNYNDPRGKVTISQGNEIIGYTDVVYNI